MSDLVPLTTMLLLLLIGVGYVLALALVVVGAWRRTAAETAWRIRAQRAEQLVQHYAPTVLPVPAPGPYRR